MAPGRVNVIGEHTDYNLGYVLPFALNRAVYVAAGPRWDGQVVVTSRQRGEERFQVEGFRRTTRLGYAEAAIWSLRELGASISGVNLVIDSTIPIGAGLSSSAAFICAVIIAAADLADISLSPREIATSAQRAETEGVGVPIGAMDPTASMCGIEGHALLLDCRSMVLEHIPFAASTPHGDSTLVIIDTQTHHRHAGGEYADRREACRRAAAALGVETLRNASLETLDRKAGDLDPVDLRRARHVVTENLRVTDAVSSMRDGNDARLGQLLTASHQSLATDFEVSTPELDLAVWAAISAGAFGARLTGGGFGGCVLAIAPTHRVRDIESEVRDAFAGNGFAEPRFLLGVSSSGAARVA
jgi:galactokinase